LRFLSLGGTMIKELENNLYESFARAKSDILKVNNDVMKINKAMGNVTTVQEKTAVKVDKLVEDQKKIYAILDKIADKIAQLEVKIEKKSVSKVEKTIVVNKEAPKKKAKPTIKKKPKEYVASKNGKAFFPVDSIQARNIKPKNRIFFKSKDAFIKRGYKEAKLVFTKVK